VAEANGGTPRFEAAAAPSREELQETLEYVYARVVKWLARRGLLREADASNEAPSCSAGEAMTLAGMQRGTLETAKDAGEPAEPERAEPPPRVTDAAVHERAAMVPPPRYPLLRLRGVLAPRHPWRARVVARPPDSHAGCTRSTGSFRPRKRRLTMTAAVKAMDTQRWLWRIQSFARIGRS
jgi:hypothetical protein